MSAIVQDRHISAVVRRFTELVVSADTAPIAFVNEATAFQTYLRTSFVADMNAMLGAGSVIEVWPVRRGGRAVLVCLASSSLVASAPANVRALAANISVDDGASFVLVATPGSDTWIIANNTEALRSGCSHWLFLCGARQPLPHAVWRVLPSDVNADALNIAAIVSPVFESLILAANGGFIGPTAPPNIPNQSALQTNWLNWFAANRFTRSYQGGEGDGDESFGTRDQWFARHDRKRLAWVNPPGERGYQHFGAPFHYPSTYFADATGASFTKINYTHHGSPGGVYDAVVPGATPWAGIAPPAIATTQAAQEAASGLSAGALDPDTNPDSGATSGTDYVSFDGLAKSRAIYKWQVWCSRVNTYGLNHPIAKYVSCEPPDGADHCFCDDCKNMLRAHYGGTADATPSDLVTHDGNSQIAYMRYKANGKARPRIGRLAYGETYRPPTITIDVDTRIELLTDTGAAFQQLLPRELLTQWQTKRNTNPGGPFTLSVEPSQLLGNTNLDRPRLSPYTEIALSNAWRNIGCTGITAQASNSSMALGFAFYAMSRWNWDPTTTAGPVLDETFALLGPAATRTRAMFERWWASQFGIVYATQFMLQYCEVSQSLADINAAQVALSATPDAAQQARLDQVIAYVLYLRFLLEERETQRKFRITPTQANEDAFWSAFDAYQSWTWNTATMCITHADRVAFATWFQDVQFGICGGDITTFFGTAASGTLLSTTGTPSVSRLRVEVTSAGLRGTAVFSWSTDGGGSWTSGVTSSATTGNVLAGTGLTLIWPAGFSFSANYRMAFSFSLRDKWNQSTPGSGFASVAEPSTGAIATALSTAVAAYPALSGITPTLFSETLVPYYSSASATLIDGPQSRSPSTYRFWSTGVAITCTFTASGFTSPATGAPCRVLVRDLAGNILQDIATNPATYGGSPVVTTINISQPAGCYELVVIETGPAGEYSWISFPRKVPNVLINGVYPFANGAGFNQSTKFYFYVPSTLTAIGLALNAAAPALQFYDDTDSPVTTVNRYQLATATVAGGHSGKPWSFSGIQNTDDTAFPVGVNFPSCFALDPLQLMGPAGLDGHN